MNLFSEALYQPSNLTVVLAACPGSEGVQDVPPSNMLLLHIDYSELKALEKQQVQEGLSDPLHLKTGHEISYKKMPSLYQEVEIHPHHQRLGIAFLLRVVLPRYDWLQNAGRVC